MTRDLTCTASGYFDLAGEAEGAVQMDEAEFRTFYDGTARPLRAYLGRLVRDRQFADDLLQESYYRLLRAGRTFEDEAHRRHYLFRIATNLVRDAHRRPRVEEPPVPDDEERAHEPCFESTHRAVRRADLSRAMARLKPRERALLWLAYTHGSSHVEIAGVLGLKASSVKSLLFRARRRLVALLGGTPRPQGDER